MRKKWAYAVCVGGFCLLSSLAYAQPSNDSIVIRLRSRLAERDSSAAAAATPRVRYQLLADELIARSISLDSLHTYSDTLGVAAYQAIRAASSRPLRGKNCLSKSYLFMPIAVVSGSIALVVSLFYARSQ